jgi:hypothetical protein
MIKKIMIITIFLLTLMACVSCLNNKNDNKQDTVNDLENTGQSNEVDINTEQKIILNINNYRPPEIVLIPVVSSEINIIHYQKEIDSNTYIMYLCKDGGVYGAYKSGDIFINFITISSAEFEYAYPDSFEIHSYYNVLNIDGFVLSFSTGANSIEIKYYYWDNSGTLKLLAEGNGINYEYDSNNDGTKDLLFIVGSQDFYLHKKINDELFVFTLPDNISDYYQDISIIFDEETKNIIIYYRDNESNTQKIYAKYDNGILFF